MRLAETPPHPPRFGRCFASLGARRPLPASGERRRKLRSLDRSFRLGTVQGIDPTRQVDDQSFQLLDTQRVKIEQLERGLLEGGWSGMEREAVLGMKGHAHRVSDQRAEMGYEHIEAHDVMAVG